jgi:DNA-binding PadR family transcriptional regulator
MSLRHALLGLLHEGPASGYELTKQVEQTLERSAWHARHSQIYPELTKMADAGLVEVVEEGPRGRRTYAITEAGRVALRDWMMATPAEPQVRSEPLLRMFLLSTLDPSDARPLLQAHADEAAAEVSRLEQVVAYYEAEQPLERKRLNNRILAEIGLRQEQASYDWAVWALSELDSQKPAPSTVDGG